MSDYETILVTREGRVGTITLNRPKALNALNSQVMVELTTAAAEFDADPGIGAIIVTGNEKAFAAGADIKEMADLSFAETSSPVTSSQRGPSSPPPAPPPSPPSPDTPSAAAASWR